MRVCCTQLMPNLVGNKVYHEWITYRGCSTRSTLGLNRFFTQRPPFSYSGTTCCEKMTNIVLAIANQAVYNVLILVKAYVIVKISKQVWIIII